MKKPMKTALGVGVFVVWIVLVIVGWRFCYARWPTVTTWIHRVSDFVATGGILLVVILVGVVVIVVGLIACGIKAMFSRKDPTSDERKRRGEE